MRKNFNKLLCMLLIPMLILTLGGCGDAGSQEPETLGDPEVIYAGAGDSEQQMAALTALKSLEGKTEETRLAELTTKLPTCPFCGKAAAWSTFQYDSEVPCNIVNNSMSTNADASSLFYVFGY